MSDSSLFKELSLEGLDEEVFSSLGAMYDEEVVKEVQELLKHSTPFKMVAIVSSLWPLFFKNIFRFFLLCLCFALFVQMMIGSNTSLVAFCICAGCSSVIQQIADKVTSARAGEEVGESLSGMG